MLILLNSTDLTLLFYLEKSSKGNAELIGFPRDYEKNLKNTKSPIYRMKDRVFALNLEKRNRTPPPIYLGIFFNEEWKKLKRKAYKRKLQIVHLITYDEKHSRRKCRFIANNTDIFRIKYDFYVTVRFAKDLVKDPSLITDLLNYHHAQEVCAKICV